MIVNRDINRWFKANANVSGFRTVVEGDEIAGIETVTGNVFTAKANFTFMIFKDFSLMVSGNYRSPEIEAQEKEEAVYFADAALKYDFLKRKASLSLRVSDVFDSRRFDSETTGEGFTITSSQRRDSRIAYLGFTYRINNYNRQKERERSGQQEQEMDEF